MDEFIEAVKAAMGMNTSAPPELDHHIRAAAAFMQGAGVPESKFTAQNHLAVGCAAIGANDIWQTESGGLEFSEVFVMMTAQLRA